MSQQINLFNPAFRKRREFFGSIMLAQAMLALLLIMGGAYAYQFRQLQDLDKAVKETAAELVQEQARQAKAAIEFAPRAKDQALLKQAEQMEQRLKGETAVLEVLQGGSLGNTDGYSAYMRAYARQIVSGLWLTDFSIQGAGREMSIGGRTLKADLVPAYILRLNQEEATQGRTFTAMQMQQPKAETAAGDTPANAKVANFLEFKLYSSGAEAAR